MSSIDDVAPQACAAMATQLLNQAAAGNAQAAADLLPLVYEHLRRLAADRMRQRGAGQTLQATALVHEAYLRLVHDTKVRGWNGRSHFFAAAAEAMRCILIDSARRKSRRKHGGGAQRVSLDDVALSIGDRSDDLLALDEALTALAERHPEKAQLVKLRYFAGLTIEEAAQALDICRATAERRWAFARAWLYKRIKTA